MGTSVVAGGGSIILSTDHHHHQNRHDSAAGADDYFHVMAVDDSIIDRKLIERLLKTSSYHVTTVDSGNKALQLLGLYDYQEEEEQYHDHDEQMQQESVQVNMIITDYCMPGITGYELLRKIKESEFLKDIPVVIMSSEYVPSRINRCLEEGAEEFFLKPVQMSDVSKLKPHLLRPKNKMMKKNLYNLTTPTMEDQHHFDENIRKPITEHIVAPPAAAAAADITI